MALLDKPETVVDTTYWLNYENGRSAVNGHLFLIVGAGYIYPEVSLKLMMAAQCTANT